MIVANAVEVSPDKQGRVLVPASLQEAAGLSGTVLVSGNLDRVELWNPATYSEDVREPVDDLGNFAHRLFG
jgi:MraZ protein